MCLPSILCIHTLCCTTLYLASSSIMAAESAACLNDAFCSAGADDANLDNILEKASSLSHISAIILVANGSQVRETITMKNVFTLLRGHLPDAVLQNALVVLSNCTKLTRLALLTYFASSHSSIFHVASSHSSIFHVASSHSSKLHVAFFVLHSNLQHLQQKSNVRHKYGTLMAACTSHQSEKDCILQESGSSEAACEGQA